jgi:hypothetical protein
LEEITLKITKRFIELTEAAFAKLKESITQESTDKETVIQFLKHYEADKKMYDNPYFTKEQLVQNLIDVLDVALYNYEAEFAKQSRSDLIEAEKATLDSDDRVLNQE